MPLIVPAIGRELQLEELLERLDGLLFTGSPSNVEPHHYRGEPSEPGTWHDPHRDDDHVAADSARGRGRRAGAGNLPRLSGDERRLRRLAVAEAARGAGAPGSSRGSRSSRSSSSTGPRTRWCSSPAGMLRRLAGTDRIQRQFAAWTGRARAGPGTGGRGARARWRDRSVSRRRPRAVLRWRVQWHPEWRVASQSFFARAVRRVRRRLSRQTSKVIYG